MARAYYFSAEDWRRMAASAHFNAGELARQIGISQRQLERWMRQVFGDTPHHWLQAERLKRAEAELKTLVPVKVVAANLGYKQVSHFSREFKRCFGASPVSYLRATVTDVAIRQHLSV